MIKWSDLPDKIADNDITLKDGIVLSHTTDGGVTFIFSKFGDMQDLVDFLAANLNVFDDDVVITGSGTGMKESNGKAGIIGGDDEVFFIAADTFFNDTDFMASQDLVTGNTWLNGKTLSRMGAEGFAQIIAAKGLLQLAPTENADKVEVGNSISVPIDAKLRVHGETADATKFCQVWTQNNGPETVILSLRNDGILFAKLGTFGEDTAGKFTIASKANFNSTDYALEQDNTTGTTILNGKGNVIFKVDGGAVLASMNAGLINIAVGAVDQNVKIGHDISAPTGGKVVIKGEDNGTIPNLTLQSLDSTEILEILNNGDFSLKNGTSVNEFSTDGTLSGNSEDKLPVEKAVKTYVDTSVSVVAAGLFPKIPTRLATTTYLDNVGVGTWTISGSGVGKTLTAGSVGILTIDGVNSVLNDRIFIKDEDGSSTNLDDIDQGIYDVTTEGTAGVAAILTRSTDFDGSIALEVRSGSYADVLEGSQNTNTGWWVISADPITVDTDPIIVALHRDPNAGSKIIFDDYIIGVTLDPETTETAEGDSELIDEMTRTWTPSSANNKIKARVTCNWSNTGDENARMAIYIDGAFQPETIVRQYANGGGGGEFNGSSTAYWEGTHATSPITVEARMWTTGGTLTAVGVERNMSVEEIRK